MSILRPKVAWAILFSVSINVYAADRHVYPIPNPCHVILADVQARSMKAALMMDQVVDELVGSASRETEFRINDPYALPQFYYDKDDQLKLVNTDRLMKIKAIYFMREGQSISPADLLTALLHKMLVREANGLPIEDSQYISNQRKIWPELYLAVLEYLIQTESRGL